MRLESLEQLFNDIRSEVASCGEHALEGRVVVLRSVLEREGFLKSPSPSRSSSPSPTPSPGPSPRNKRQSVERRDSAPFHIHRNAPFKPDVSLEARHLVHFHHLCSHGHWHGTTHKVHTCPKCVAGCGGVAWSRAKEREDGKLVLSERKRLSSLLTQAMHIALHKARIHNPYADFQGKPLEVEKIMYQVPAGWVRARTKVALEDKPFARGAMRECWRMIEGEGAPCVAKRYMAEQDPLVYWIDTEMQAVAKHYASLFSQHSNCFDTVDFIEAYMVRSTDALYSVERFLSGKYIKYNNNSGTCFTARNTPQAFSHFTWCQSEGNLMVVDIQGVGDLYTDPQIHTVDGSGYGEGNLGLTGVAMFFQTHTCNHICKAMGLTPYEIYTRHPTSRGDEGHTTTLRDFAREAMQRTMKSGASVSYTSLPKKAIVPTSQLLNGACSDQVPVPGNLEDPHSPNEGEPISPPDQLQTQTWHRVRSPRGVVHRRLSELHAQGRFTDGLPDIPAAFYHLQLAAMHNDIPGLLGLARLYSGLPRDNLSDLVDVPEHRDLCIILLERAYSLGSYDAAAYLALLLSDGIYTPKNRSLAIQCLQALGGDTLKKEETNHFGWGGHEMTDLKRLKLLGELLAEATGDLKQVQQAVDAFSEAADLAMELGKGSEAMKLYAKVEELQALLPDE